MSLDTFLIFAIGAVIGLIFSRQHRRHSGPRLWRITVWLAIVGLTTLLGAMCGGLWSMLPRERGEWFQAPTAGAFFGGVVGLIGGATFVVARSTRMKRRNIGWVFICVLLGTEALFVAVLTSGGPIARTVIMEPISSVQSESEWAVTFEYAFPPESWSVGEHQYTFLFESCPTGGELPGRLSISFRVAEDAPRREGVVYLHPTGLSVGSVYGPFLEMIHPSQPTIATLSNIQLTQAEAQEAARDCKLFITWDGGPAQQLLPGEPYKYDQ